MGSESSGSSTSLSNSEHAELVGFMLGLGSSDSSHASDVSESVEVSSTSSSEHSSVVVSNVAEISVLRLGDSTEVTVDIVTSGDGLGEVDVTSSVALVPDGFTSGSAFVTSTHGSALVPGVSSSHVSSVELSNFAVFVMPVGLNAESSHVFTEDTTVHFSVGFLEAEHALASNVGPAASVSSLLSSLSGVECLSATLLVSHEVSSLSVLLADFVSPDTHGMVVSGSIDTVDVSVLVAETVLDSTTDGITEGTVVAVFPSSRASVGESSTGSVFDCSIAVAHTSTSTGMLTTTLVEASA